MGSACKLFELLIEPHLTAHVMMYRPLINMYSSNFLRTAWSGVVSDYLAAVYGVKQGDVSSSVRIH